MEISQAALSISEASKFLGVGRTTLYHLIRRGELPVVRLGGRTLIHRVDAEALLDAHKHVASCANPTGDGSSLVSTAEEDAQ